MEVVPQGGIAGSSSADGEAAADGGSSIMDTDSGSRLRFLSPRAPTTLVDGAHVRVVHHNATKLLADAGVRGCVVATSACDKLAGVKGVVREQLDGGKVLVELVMTKYDARPVYERLQPGVRANLKGRTVLILQVEEIRSQFAPAPPEVLARLGFKPPSRPSTGRTIAEKCYVVKQLDIEGDAYGEPINAFFGDLDDLHIVAPSAHFLHQDDLDLELTSEVKRIFEAHTPGGPLPNTAELYTWCIPVAITDEEANLSGAICSFDRAFGGEEHQGCAEKVLSALQQIDGVDQVMLEEWSQHAVVRPVGEDLFLLLAAKMRTMATLQQLLLSGDSLKQQASAAAHTAPRPSSPPRPSSSL